MLSKNNLSPLQLSLFSSLLLSLISSLLLFFFSVGWVHILIFFLTVFIITSWLIYQLFHSFIQRQIRMIYKLIAQTKATKREEFYYKNILPSKTIEEAREDVEKWASQYSREIEVLQQNEQYRKEFLQNLSHELKTPIFSIQGYIDTIISGAIDNRELCMKFLQNTSKNVDRLVNLTDDLDQITKLEIGELKLQTTSFVIQELTKEVFEVFSLRSEEKRIHCSIKKDSEIPVMVIADKEKIRQVLINIIDNALKYGKVNGKIEAAFYKLENHTALIEISDDGEGISEEHRQRIFERFYRIDQARSRTIGGSGLGLAICKHIIEAHQQNIHVRSTPDVGSTFCFSLPLK